MSGDTSTASVSTRSPDDDGGGDDVECVLEALGDGDCRDILREMGAAALTASECSTACDLPLSTTYRKLERLSEAGLVEEGLRIRRDGKHASQYRRRFEEVVVDVTDVGTFGVAVHPRSRAEDGVTSSVAGD